MPSGEIIIFDTEYWADERSQEQRWNGLFDYPPLLIQIAAVKLRLTCGLTVTDEFEALISPIDEFARNVPLNRYFTDLTGITQAKIDREGVDLSVAMKTFSRFTKNCYCYSYGNDLLDTIVPSCFIQHVPCPFQPTRFRDLRTALLRTGMSEKELYSNSSGSLAEHLGLSGLNSNIHNAMDDVQSLIASLDHLLRCGSMKNDWLINPEIPLRTRPSKGQVPM